MMIAQGITPSRYLFKWSLLMGIMLSALVSAALVIGQGSPSAGVVLTYTSGRQDGGVHAIDTNRLIPARVSYPPPLLVVDIPHAALNGLRFVYETSRMGKLEIAVRAGVGKALYDTAEGIEDRLPALSPDGSRLAYWTAPELSVASRFQNWNLAILDFNHGSVTPITTSTAILPYGRPIWSLDGSRLAVRYWHAGTDEGIFMVDAASGALTSLRESVSDTNEIAWSPDGSRLAFRSTYAGEDDIYLFDVDANRVRRLTDHPASERAPDWSPDGQHIVFASFGGDRNGVYIINADGEGLHRLFPVGRLPRWSPSGEQVALIVRHGWQDVLYVINADGSQPHPVAPLDSRTTFIGWLKLS